MNNKQGAITAKLIWDDHGLPLSEEFGDYYFSKKNGLEEARYVYLQNNRLPQRFQTLTSGDHFVVGEVGFGSGLNFLATWHLWQQLAPKDASLQFISVEKYPLHPDDLHKALALWPELKNLANQLRSAYPRIPNSGFHRLSFVNSRVQLTLIIDEARSGLQQLLETTHPAFSRTRRPVDAWFLDGFSPSKNPELWQPELFQMIRQLSSEKSTLSTFTAASMVNRGLKASGFDTEKVKGFGLKREMLKAKMTPSERLPTTEELFNSRRNLPGPAPWMTHSRPANPSKSTLIIGGGLAGCHTAFALAQRGWQITLLEQRDTLAAEGSGNPQGVVYAKLSHQASTLSDFNLLALQFAQNFYSPFWQAGQGQILTPESPFIGDQCGVIQLAFNPKVAQLQQKLSQHFPEQQLFQPLTKQQATDISGIEHSFSGLYFPRSGWIDPGALCRKLVSHPNIDVQTGVCAERLEQSGLSQWTIETRNSGQKNHITSNCVIVCTAAAVKQFDQTTELPVKPIRGQVTNLNATTLTKQLKTVICGDGYISPAANQQHCLGATFNQGDLCQQVREQDDNENLARLKAQVPGLADSLSQNNICGGRVGFRCTTPDYLPIVGAAPKYHEYLQTFAGLRKNARASIPAQGPIWNNLFVNLGHGSRGLAYTPISAELLASQINREPSPVGYTMETALHPARFWIRALSRGKL